MSHYRISTYLFNVVGKPTSIRWVDMPTVHTYTIIKKFNLKKGNRDIKLARHVHQYVTVGYQKSMKTNKD